MTQLTITLVLICLAAAAFLVGRRKAVRVTGGRTSALHSRPVYHGWYVALACGLPAVSLWFLVLLVVKGLLLRLRLAEGSRDFDLSPLVELLALLTLSLVLGGLLL